MRLLCVGDTHGNIVFMENMFGQARKRGCEKIIVVGDYGYWPNANWGRAFITAVAEMSKIFDIATHWVDGNHDNHPALWGEDEKYSHGTAFLNTGGNSWYIPRGMQWEWDGLQFAGMGGAWSIDKDQRVPGESWWPTETIRDKDIDWMLDTKADVLFSHDTVSYVKVPNILAIRESELNREKIDVVVRNIRPELIIHGHYHVRYSAVGSFPYDRNGELDWHEFQVEGLDCDKHKAEPWQSFGVLDTDKFNDKDKRFTLT